MQKQILLSFDIEEFDAPQEYGQSIPKEQQLATSLRGLERIVTLLDHLDLTATFFITANFAQHEPACVKQLAQRHEIASHGFWHSSFEENDLAKSRQTLEAISGQTVMGFRRARLAETDRRAIAAAGYRYNSSENPIWLPGRYNHFRDARTAYLTDELLNVPISASPLLRVPLFWLVFKNFPMWLIKATSRRTLGADGYLNIFFHPWEFCDISQTKLPWYVRRRCGQPMLNRLEHYLRWLKQRGGTFITLGEFDKQFRASHSQGSGS
jgi:peptidoglycan/xylan/chitin deacetylase (PgdA/CDA1 family)